jgi:anti-anti-sigma factor
MEGVSPDQVVEVSTRREGAGVVIAVAGELDLHGSDRVTEAVAEALVDSVAFVDIDARRLTFVDSAGIRAILLARAEVESRGSTFTVSGVSPAVRRIMEIAGAEAILPAGD